MKDEILRATKRQERLQAVIARYNIKDEIKSDLLCCLLVIRGCLGAVHLRALANAIDGEDDWKDAMLKDLKEENSAYQRGLEDGKKECMAAIKEHETGTMFMLTEDKSLLVLGPKVKKLA